MVKNKLIKNAKKIDQFLIKFLNKQSSSLLVKPMKYGIISGGKKIRSTIIFDTGKIFNIKEKKLINICAAVECIHSYSLIHDDLPCMDNDKIRRGKPSTHIKFGEASAVLAGSSLLTLAFEIIADKKYSLNVEMKAINRQIKLISEIDKALMRIKDDTYGFCLDTAEPIGLKRLMARPVAKYTIAAQEKHEKDEKVHADD